MIRKYIYSVVASVCLMGTVTSCSDFLSEYSQDMVVAKEVSHFDELLLGSVYVPSVYMQGGVSPSTVCGFLNILDDDVNTGKGAGAFGNRIDMGWTSTMNPTFGYFAWQLQVGRNYTGTNTVRDDGTWNDLYYRIFTINVILNEITDLPHSTKEDEATYWRVQGEAHFLRGYFFYILANLYSNMYTEETADKTLSVPLKLTPYIEHDKSKKTQFTRASVKDVYEQIVKDLKAASEYLTRSPQVDSHRLYRVSAEAADLMLSRVYLYMQNWKEAEAYADKVIASKNVSLARLSSISPDNPFLSENNGEIIFSQGPNYLMAPNRLSGAPGTYCVSHDLYDLYDQENDRRVAAFFEPHYSTDSIGLSNKYGHSTERPRVSDVFTLRVSEAYLNKAEACAMQGGKDAEACTVLNKLRKERITDYKDRTYTGSELVNQIRLERRKELCFEGQRWFDLRRYAVNKQYPYKRQILHVLNVCGDDVDYLLTRYYVLKEDDPAYTFSIPKTTINFDNVPMPDNPREERKPLEVKDNENGTDEEGTAPVEE